MSKSKPKLLIVEDEVYSQIFYSSVLESDYDVTTVPTVDRAIKAMEETQFKLAIVDLSLPGEKDGISLLKYICKDKSDITTPIVITAHAFPKNRESAMAAGAVEFLTKPILSESLLEVVKRYIHDAP
ncbi:MAG: response regulator [Candidatus Marinimicrobia bacterium]|jgi:CheY-like chemotaxis protein|nr:response regulator [Candidatus Neomarinimicrobiota bacterium]MBT3680299.1 response regulator [Candidatus Neomarinimicrobiota bacterium]MBT3950412.1 response regulator [Candidatus Neomarinimicrobiota bacterium]MBT4254045.1 response regulator [Candidatus Neomarinimicrobiota bacterium]MBT4480109.1 response regulator [Candidatus Neomarinimicrobiota bacterium]